MARMVGEKGDEPIELRCNRCSKTFEYSEELEVHSKTNPDCMTEAGKCFYYDYCSFSTNSKKQLANHMREESCTHLEAMALTINSLTYALAQLDEPCTTEAEELINSKLQSLQGIAGETSNAAHNVSKKYQELVEKNLVAERIIEKVENNADHLETLRQQLNDYHHTYELTTRTIQKDGGTQSIQEAIDELAAEIKKITKEYLENTPDQSYDGVLRWDLKVNEGDLAEIESFYTSKYGYRFGATAKIADETVLLHVFQKVGEFDALLKFPCPRAISLKFENRENGRIFVKQVLPTDDPDNFYRPVDGRNEGVKFELSLSELSLAKSAPPEENEKPKPDYTLYIEVTIKPEEAEEVTEETEKAGEVAVEPENGEEEP